MADEVVRGLLVGGAGVLPYSRSMAGMQINRSTIINNSNNGNSNGNGIGNR